MAFVLVANELFHFQCWVFIIKRTTDGVDIGK